jgi:hypothetical protein
MAYSSSGTHFVIARNEKEAARNVLTYPHAVEDDYDISVAASRLHGVREQFGDEFDVFLVRTQVHVDERASTMLGSCQEE